MSDFTASLNIGVVFSKTELDTGVDFTPSGDLGQIVITSTGGFGEGGFGEGGFGGSTTTLVLSGGLTTWTNINTP